jgi:hypothetical protein
MKFIDSSAYGQDSCIEFVAKRVSAKGGFRFYPEDVGSIYAS